MCNAARHTLPLNMTTGSGFVTFYGITKFITLFTREALQWKQLFYGYVSLHMFKISLNKK